MSTPLDRMAAFVVSFDVHAQHVAPEATNGILERFGNDQPLLIDDVRAVVAELGEVVRERKDALREGESLRAVVATLKEHDLNPPDEDASYSCYVGRHDSCNGVASREGRECPCGCHN